MLAWRLALVMIHLWTGVSVCAVIFPWIKGTRRESFVRWWSRRLLAIVRVEIRLCERCNSTAGEQVLIVANHVSWLDIFLLNSLLPCHFVAKADIRNWPMVGWMSEKAGTIFLARGKQREVRRIYEGLVHQIQAGRRIAFFPEGTTARQGSILPFHANLFEAAIEAQVPIQPFAIRYLKDDGTLQHSVDFLGETTFVESMTAILKGGKITAELSQLPTISTAGAHRREVAQAAQLAIAQDLGIDL